MIITPRFVFPHLHKSGGTFVNEALLNHLPGAVKTGHHRPASQLPPACVGLRVLGVVRNPWDFYVSWFTFQSRRREYVWRVFSDEGQLDFAATTERMLRAGEAGDLIDRLVEFAPADFPNRQVNLTKACIEGLRGFRGGWYTFLFRRMYGDLPVHFIRKENLRQELLDFLREMGVVSPALTGFVLHPADPIRRRMLTTAPSTRNLSRGCCGSASARWWRGSATPSEPHVPMPRVTELSPRGLITNPGSSSVQTLDNAFTRERTLQLLFASARRVAGHPRLGLADSSIAR
ncbi:MAG: hypothetical protein ACHQ9S_04010 [Candidatus Binatia bacterium]